MRLDSILLADGIQRANARIPGSIVVNTIILLIDEINRLLQLSAHIVEHQSLLLLQVILMFEQKLANFLLTHPLLSIKFQQVGHKSPVDVRVSFVLLEEG